LTDKALIGAVFRLGKVAVSREALEDALGMPISRYEPYRSGDKFYAQIDIAKTGDLWPQVLLLCERLDKTANTLIETGAISDIDLDLGYSFYDSKVSASTLIPSKVAEAVGQAGVNIMVTFHLTTPSE